jgi:carbamoyl-phosphate synthase large subunit
MRFAVEASPERPVLVDKFLEDATEVDVDCITDVGHFAEPGEGTIVIGGMLEHIEFAGVHSGDAAMVLPPHTLSQKVIGTIREYTHAMAREAESHRPDERAIRREGRQGLCAGSEPARLAHRALRQQGHRRAAGQARRQGDGGQKPEGTWFSPRKSGRILGGEGIGFPFNRFHGQDILLSPEMRSTGEVMGLDADLGVAYAKSQMAANSPLPLSGKVFISVSDQHKGEVAAVAKQFADLGFELVATSGTAAVLEKAGLKVQRVFKLLEGRPNVVDFLKNKEIQLVINTPAGQSAARGRDQNPHHRRLHRHAHHDHVERGQGRRARHRRLKKAATR